MVMKVSSLDYISLNPKSYIGSYISLQTKLSQDKFNVCLRDLDEDGSRNLLIDIIQRSSEIQCINLLNCIFNSCLLYRFTEGYYVSLTAKCIYVLMNNAFIRL